MQRLDGGSCSASTDRARDRLAPIARSAALRPDLSARADKSEVPFSFQAGRAGVHDARRRGSHPVRPRLVAGPSRAATLPLATIDEVIDEQ